MSKYSNSYSGNNFLEWWKAHYGTDYNGSGNIIKNDKMTEADVAIGKQLLSNYGKQQYLDSQYQTNKMGVNNKFNDLITGYDNQLSQVNSNYQKNTADLLSNYSNAQSSLDRSKKSSQQMASIAYDKLKKYLPTQLKVQGLGGLGVSASTALQAQNSYVNKMGEIEAGYNDDKAKLLSNYYQNKNLYDAEHSQDLLELEEKKNSAKYMQAEELQKLEENYLDDKYSSDKDENGNLLVDNVLKEYADKESKVQDNLYSEYSGQLAERAEMSFGEDGRISSSDFYNLNSWIDDRRSEVGEANYQYLKAELEDYKRFIREEEEEVKLNKNSIINSRLDEWQAGVDESKITVHEDYGGGFSLAPGMKVKIKNGDNGMSIATFTSKANKSGKDGLNSGEEGWFGSEKKNSKAIAKLAEEGKLTNGTIVDTNREKGTKYWVYLDGKFYRIEITQ